MTTDARALRRLSPSRLPLAKIMLAVSVVLNLVMATQLMRARQAARGRAPEARLEEGAHVGAISAKGLSGESVSVSYREGGPPVILYVFSPTCAWCKRNLENARALAEATRGKYNFVALSLSDEGVGEYVAEHRIDYAVYDGLSAGTRAEYRLGGTPQTIVVSPEGRVLKNWVGAYSPEIAKQVEAYFGVALPGLSEAEAKAPARAN